jgi:pyruvate,water dikinase
MASPTDRLDVNEISQIVWFEEIGIQDVAQVGGKNASLGEMMQHLKSSGVKVPRGFATTAAAYQNFLAQNQLDVRIHLLLQNIDIENVDALGQVAAVIRNLIIETPFLPQFVTEVTTAYQTLIRDSQRGLCVAVRSSATAEDLDDASFAGQQETFLNIQGIDQVLAAIKNVFASLFTDRVIAYRAHHGYDKQPIAISVGIQQMVCSDEAASGVLFTIDTESGFDKVILITASYGLGDPIVKGQVDPDEFYVYKPNLEKNYSAILRRILGSKREKMIFADSPDIRGTVKLVPVPEKNQNTFCLTDAEIETLARYALLIEKHYGRAMDIEWAKDANDNEIYILQARPETVKSRKEQVSEQYRLTQPGKVIVTGRSIGQKIGAGKARVLTNLRKMSQFSSGDVLVTEMTDPDWEPIMKRASAIVTDRGGRTCHAAIVARELGIPAVVGCGNATSKIADDQLITVSCAEGDTGYVYEQKLDFHIHLAEHQSMPPLAVKIMMNVANPERAFGFREIINAGVGLARIEFIINQTIGIHPKALLEYARQPKALQEKIAERIACYGNPVEYYVERLKEGIATIAAAFYPKPVIVRLSDFKTNEYANLLGGHAYEPHEENPMLGFRGASRYIADAFSDCFQLECQALKRVREVMDLKNVEIMIPFVRTVKEAKQTIELLAQNGLVRGENGLRIIMMCEIPSNALLADEFLEHFDGFSIGSNDLTQLALGLDRDSATVAELFDERDAAVKILLKMAIDACKMKNKYIGICGQGPSDHPDLAKWLMQQGIDSISLNPDSVVDTWIMLAND